MRADGKWGAHLRSTRVRSRPQGVDGKILSLLTGSARLWVKDPVLLNLAIAHLHRSIARCKVFWSAGLLRAWLRALCTRKRSRFTARAAGSGAAGSAGSRIAIGGEVRPDIRGDHPELPVEVAPKQRAPRACQLCPARMHQRTCFGLADVACAARGMHTNARCKMTRTHVKVKH